MEDLGVHLQDEEREEFFEYVKDRLRPPRNSGVSIYDHFDTNSSVIWKPQNGNYSAVPFDLFADLYSVAFESEPRYDLSELERYVEREFTTSSHMNEESLSRGRGATRRMKAVDDNRDFFSFVFNHFELEELVDRFGGTESLFKNWRTGKTRTVDADALEEAAEEVNEFYNSPPDIQPDLIDLKAYKGNSLDDSTIVEEVDVGTLEVLFYRGGHEDLRETARMLEEGGSEIEEYPEPGPRVEYTYPLVLNHAAEKADDSGFVKASRIDVLEPGTAGYGLSYLEDAGLIESWGSRSNGVYTIESDKSEIYDAWRQIANSQRD